MSAIESGIKIMIPSIPISHKYQNYINLTSNTVFWKSLEKVSFYIASEASYVYILSGQQLIENAKNGQFGEFLKNWSLRSNSVTRQVSFNRTIIGGKCQNSKIQMRHLE